MPFRAACAFASAAAAPLSDASEAGGRSRAVLPSRASTRRVGERPGQAPAQRGGERTARYALHLFRSVTLSWAQARRWTSQTPTDCVPRPRRRVRCAARELARLQTVTRSASVLPGQAAEHHDVPGGPSFAPVSPAATSSRASCRSDDALGLGRRQAEEQLAFSTSESDQQRTKGRGLLDFLRRDKLTPHLRFSPALPAFSACRTRTRVSPPHREKYAVI
jgi:hypothetical protein